MSVSQGNGSKRRRHVPVRNAQHVYWSECADGSKSYSVRHPVNAEGQRPYETVGKSLEVAKQRAREVHDDGAVRILSVGTTFSDVVTSWKASRDIRPRSAEIFDLLLRVHIEPALGRKRVRDITPVMLAGFLSGLQRKDGRPGPLSESTKRLILDTINVVLGHAVEIGALGSVPRVPRKRAPKKGAAHRRILTQEEEARLLAYCAPFPWLRGIVTVALHQALRIGEVTALRWEDVDFAAGKLRIARSLDRHGNLGLPKGGKVETIPLMPAAREALLELNPKLDAEGFIFTGPSGAPWPSRYVQTMFGKARDRAAIMETDEGKVVVHSLRNTGISRLANDPRIPLVHVRDFARHSSVVMTETYIRRIENEEVTAAMGEALAAGREAA